MRTKYRVKCARRTPKPQPIEVWAKSVIADPTAHYATKDEAAYVALLLAEMDGAR